MFSHKYRVISWKILAPRPPIHFLHKIFPGTSGKITVPNFTALAVFFPDYQNQTYVKQQNIALPFFYQWYHTFFPRKNVKILVIPSLPSVLALGYHDEFVIMLFQS